MNFEPISEIQQCAEEIRSSYDSSIFSIVQHVSYNCVRTGSLPEEYPVLLESSERALPKYDANLSKIEHLLEDTEEFATALRKSRPFSIYCDALGREHTLSDLPSDAMDLDENLAILLLNRFSDHFRNSFSSGRAATCFETHINYILGSSDRLTGVQRRLIINMCRIVRHRPLPSLFLAHNILQYLDDPRSLRVILSASIWNKKRNIERVLNCADEIFRVISEKSSASIKILFLGFSQAQILMLQRLMDIAKKHGKNIDVYIPALERRFLSSSKILSILEEHGIYAFRISLSELRGEPISFALSGTKLISWSENGRLHVLCDRESVKFYNEYVKQRMKDVDDHVDVPIIAIGGLFKFWPRRFRAFYRNAFIQENNKHLFDVNAFLNPKQLAYVATERGLLSRKELVKDSFMSDLENDSKYKNILFLTKGRNLSLMNEKDTLFDRVFGDFIFTKNSKVESSNFEDEANRVTEILFSPVTPEYLDKAEFEEERKLTPGMIRKDFRDSKEVPAKMGDRKPHLSIPVHLQQFDADKLRMRTVDLERVFVLSKMGDNSEYSTDAIVEEADRIFCQFRDESSNILAFSKGDIYGPYSSGLLFFNYIRENILRYCENDQLDFDDLITDADSYVRELTAGFSKALTLGM